MIGKPGYKPEFECEYKLTASVLYMIHHGLFKHVGIKKDETDKRSSLNLCLDAINLGNILHYKSVSLF